MTERMVMWLVFGFLGISAVITFASIFLPNFVASGGATIAGIVLGAFVSLLAGAGVGAGVTRSIRRNNNSRTEDNGD